MGPWIERGGSYLLEVWKKERTFYLRESAEGFSICCESEGFLSCSPAFPEQRLIDIVTDLARIAQIHLPFLEQLEQRLTGLEASISLSIATDRVEVEFRRFRGFGEVRVEELKLLFSESEFRELFPALKRALGG